MRKKIYFAGSIRGGRGDKKLYEEIIQLLKDQYGDVLTEHVGDQNLSAKGENEPDDAYIYTRDMAWLSACSVVVAEVSTPSLGVGYEIAKAEELGKRVICLHRPATGNLSAMIAGSTRLQVFEYNAFTDLEAIFNKEMTNAQNL